MRGVTEWLESIGLSEYAQRFAENGIDLSVVRDLTEQDLKELGVLLGHRRKLLRAIAELDDEIRPPAKTELYPGRPDEGERRHLTVMFCDLVGSTALAARLDPEDMRTLIGAYHTCITEVISRYHGKIARYMGDGVLVYFGYPQAHEDDAEQAVRAALAIIDAVANIRNVAAALEVRVGIATGTVVVTELLIESVPAEQAVVGETPNLAARLQTMAEPGSVLICASTRRLTGGEFDYCDLGPVALKGWAEPVRAYQVLRASGVESRFEAMHTTKLPPLFGRDEEMELLLRRWQQAIREEGRVVTLTGEPGIGKSHIASALNERLQGESHVTLRYFCSEHHTHSALFPFINQLERAAGFKHGDSPQRSYPSSTLCWRNPRVIPNTWRFWQTCWCCRPMITTGCRTSLHKNVKRRPSPHYWPSLMDWRRGSRSYSFSKMCTGLILPRLICSQLRWSMCRSLGHWC
ncbi:adenylate/guanylate cyclase domain-containing protein [Bradyrhizobium sp. BR 1432]|uniref:adenylate/guanylate cyclase domain-containing protein n=1 Tax=Bradyrhizobium sp. BR 1432 TaxID=3447966 RepID=UPI003EE4F8C8